MAVKEARLEPGWLKRELADVAALQRAYRKIVEADGARRTNGYSQPTSIEFTSAELSALAYMARHSGMI